MCFQGHGQIFFVDEAWRATGLMNLGMATPGCYIRGSKDQCQEQLLFLVNKLVPKGALTNAHAALKTVQKGSGGGLG